MPHSQALFYVAPPSAVPHCQALFYMVPPSVPHSQALFYVVRPSVPHSQALFYVAPPFVPHSQALFYVVRPSVPHSRASIKPPGDGLHVGRAAITDDPPLGRTSPLRIRIMFESLGQLRWLMLWTLDRLIVSSSPVTLRKFEVESEVLAAFPHTLRRF